MASRGARGPGGRAGSAVVIEEVSVSPGGPGEDDLSAATAASPQPGGYQSPRRQPQEQRGAADRSASGPAASPPDPPLQAAAANQEASPPTERPVERKSYSLARRTRSRPSDLGSKQASVEEAAAGGSTSSPGSGGGKTWAGDGTGPTAPAGGGGGAGLAELDQDVARLSLAQQNWNQGPTSYMRSEMRGESSGPGPVVKTGLTAVLGLK